MSDKSINIFVKAYRYLNQRVFPTAVIYNWLFCKKHPEYSVFVGRMTGMDEWMKKNGIKKNRLFSIQQTRVCENKYWGEKNQKGEEELFEFPELYFFRLEDVRVYGGVKTITDQKTIVLPIYNEDTKKRWVYYDNLLKSYNQSRAILRYRRSNQIIGRAIHLCGSAGGNYFHFLIEVLPKLALLEERGLYKDYPIIVDSFIKNSKSLQEALERVNVSKRKIMYLEDTTAYQVRDLVYISEVSLMPMNIGARSPSLSIDYAMSVKALQSIRESITRGISAQAYDKIYVARYRTKNPRLRNDQDIAELFQKAGFEVVFPETMSFGEQVAVFMGAKYVAGCMGAALTNILFCENDAQIYVVTPREHTTKLWSTYGSITGKKVITVAAKITRKAEFRMGDVFELNQDVAQEIIECINNENL